MHISKEFTDFVSLWTIRETDAAVLVTINVWQCTLFMCSSTLILRGGANQAECSLLGPITAQITCELTRRQCISACDWPAEPYPQSHKPIDPPYLRYSQDQIILKLPVKYRLFQHLTTALSEHLSRRKRSMTPSITLSKGFPTAVQRNKEQRP